MMTRQEKKLAELIAPAASALGCELVGCQQEQAGPSGLLLRLYVDKPGGATVEDCEKVSRQAGALLDVEDVVKGRYRLEVSTPGLERPLFTIEQFDAVVGKVIFVKAKLPIDERRKFKGTLLSIEGEEIRLEVDQKPVNIAFANIAKANVVFEF